ncbi:hypothetical protein [Cryptosporangium phraense]|uniref:hypothetical protein n=1 Tax=Cryptosporangium phraense TaxID=2593070 RepID=UPI00197AAD1D|nr:hypothetical protein [Cryptosporangium phraense]
MIRQHRPDIDITNNIREGWDPEGASLNVSHHVVTERAVLDAGNRWVSRDQIEGEGLDRCTGHFDAEESWRSPKARFGAAFEALSLGLL